jgi:hypothetical protein
VFTFGVSHRCPFTTVGAAWTPLITGTHHGWHPATRPAGGRVGSTETGRTPERVWEGMRRCQLVVTGQSLFGGVHLEAVCQLVRAAQRGRVPAVDFVGVMPRRSRATRRRKCSGNRRSSRQIRTRVGVSGQALSGDGSPIRASDWMRARFSAWAASSGGTSW